MSKFANQVSKLSSILSSINIMAEKAEITPLNATVVSEDYIQIDGSENTTKFQTGESKGTRIQVKVQNHALTRVDTSSVIEDTYDDKNIKEQISDLQSAIDEMNERNEENSSDSEDLFDRLTEYLNTLVDGLDENDEVDDEVGELLDEVIDNLQDNLEEVETLVDEIKQGSEETNQLAKAAYDGVYPITSDMRNTLGELFELADMDTAQTEEISASYEREGEYSQAKAEYHYNQSKSASRWSQSISAELDAWAKDDTETQAKITAAQNALDTANKNLVSLQEKELKAEEVHKQSEKEYNTAYKIYLKAQTEGNTEKINQAKTLVDNMSDAVYGSGCTKSSFTAVETAISTLENKIKNNDGTTETCASEIAKAKAELAKFSGNTGSLYALLECRLNTAIAEAEVGTAVYGIHQLGSSIISQKADEILLAVKQQYVDDKIEEASISIKKDAVDTTIKQLNSDGSLAKGTLIHDYNGGSLVCKIGNKIGCLANANGSFDIVQVEWKSSTDSDGNTVYTPTVLSNALSRTDQNGLTLSTGESFSKNGIDGMFYVGKSTSYTTTIPAKKGGVKLSLTRSELMSSYPEADKNWLNSGGFRPVGLARFSTNHVHICKISGWNFNPSVTDDSSASLSLAISRNGVDSTSKAQSVTVYIQIFWIKCAISRVDTTSIPTDDDSYGNDGVTELIDSSLSGYMKGELNDKVLRVYITD